MCGLVGVVDLRGEPVAHETLRRMSEAVAHRGRDGEGLWVEGGVGLGHRRLAIIDLSPAGRQPMLTPDGRYAIVYNGEIYNFQELRAELQGLGHGFISQSDTEVLLHAFQEWGPACLGRLNGMFAFGIWDRQARRLFLARDRHGIKPLYYWTDGRRFAFASEIKSLLTLPGFQRRICLPAVHQYFTFQNVFTDETFFEGVRLLPAAHTLTIGGGEIGTPVAFWDYRFGLDTLDITEDECVDELFSRFQRSSVRQLVSDVPLGSYLSGGMDSGSLTAVASQHLGRIHSFTAGFDLTSASGIELGFDERLPAEMMANTFKTEHYEVVLHAGDMEHVIGDLVWHLEDLRVGQSYPNYYVARLASRFVKVVLSGAGGDELFGGYPWRYFQVAGSRSPEEYFRNYYGFWQRLVSDEEKARLFQPAVQRALSGHSTFDVFRGVFANHPLQLETTDDYINHSLYFEAKTFLHGLLVVEDKISMAHGLESRVPFLDDEVVDFAMRVPIRYKVEESLLRGSIDEDDVTKRARWRSSSEGKTVLRKAMSRLIPREIIERKKQGFSGPYDSWYRGESLDYIRRLLTSPASRYPEYIDPGFVAGVIEEHTSAKRNHRLLIWSLLCFEVWLRKFM
ncbi:MAG TPA: asparagine synthase (glutamine-hydrolyzing) [Gemmatimonadales bacterium]|nr:asparagine synthase (glutamine-hydrolyzing) [Gemmatimonadales bacterium]